MRIAFVGKGGSGKTTSASLFVRMLKEKSQPVLAIDADLNQHLGSSVGFEGSAPLALGLHQAEIKRVLAGTSKYAKPEDMIKTTPPSTGSWIARSIFDFEEKFLQLFTRDKQLLMGNVGEQQDEDVGIRCYHSKTGVVELLLNHLVEQENEIVVVDMVAGADAFASGLYDKFDLTIVVVEPTQKSIQVFKQYASQAEKLGVTVYALGNKIMNDDDMEFLREELGDQLIATLTQSMFVRKEERGNKTSINELEEENEVALMRVYQKLRDVEKDWKKYLQRTIEIHRKNARSWGNTSKGIDLEQQIDRSFSYQE